jgi:hypothetical protein
MSIALILITFIVVLIILLILGDHFLRPVMLHWGATPHEIHTLLAGDDLISNPLLLSTRAISINTTPENIWPWIVQMGQGRGGFYSYDWLENLIGLNIHNADHIIPELQILRVGDLIPFWRGAGVKVINIEPPCLLVLGGTIYADTSGNMGGTWVFALQEMEPGVTRLLLRTRVAKFPPLWFSIILCRLLIEPAHFIMERGMLYGIRKRTEAGTMSTVTKKDKP